VILMLISLPFCHPINIDSSSQLQARPAQVSRRCAELASRSMRKSMIAAYIVKCLWLLRLHLQE
jgi:hypothetical protein